MFKKSKPLKKPGDYDHAYNYALFLLNLSMRTEGEVREKMSKRGYFPEIIDKVINQLRDIDKYIDDGRYAEVYIESMKRYKYYGIFMMKKKLAEKKLDRQLVEDKLEELVSDEDLLDIASRYVVKEFGPLKEVRKFGYEEKQKIMRRLLSRGFSLGLVKELVE